MQAGRQADRQACRQADRQAGMQANRRTFSDGEDYTSSQARSRWLHRRAGRACEARARALVHGRAVGREARARKPRPVKPGRGH
eukprot:4453205-Heterocapsa_arctica.AAC.1